MRSIDRRTILSRVRELNPAIKHGAPEWLPAQVITQALADIARTPLKEGVLRKNGKPRATEENSRIEFDRREAIAWVCNPNKDFITVCDLASIKPRQVRDLALELMEIARAS